MKKRKSFLVGLVLGIMISMTVSFFLLPVMVRKELTLTRGEYQEKQVAQQIELIESVRKEGFPTLVGNVLDKIDADLKDNPKRILSDVTIARIAAACYSFKSYSVHEGDSLFARKLSPEKGQLLLALSRMMIDSGSLKKIFQQASFSDADLREADLSGANLRGADLCGADLQGANLEGAFLTLANLKSANLWGAHLRGAHLSKADAKRADLRWADLIGANLDSANLNGVNLSSAQLRKTNLHGALIQWADLTGAFFSEANMASADLFGSSLHRAHLDQANLAEARLELTHLTETNFAGSNLKGVYLSRAMVSEANWTHLLKEWLVAGAEEIPGSYKIVDTIHNGQAFYRLVKI